MTVGNYSFNYCEIPYKEKGSLFGKIIRTKLSYSNVVFASSYSSRGVPQRKQSRRMGFCQNSYFSICKYRRFGNP